MALIEIKDLKLYYPVRRGWFGKKQFVRAVDGVSLSIEAGEMLGLVGESGCGKSSLGRAVVHLEPPTGGQILFRGEDLAGIRGEELRKRRRDFQMIFQDPYGSLNPRLSIRSALDEVLKLHSGANAAERAGRAAELMKMVGLDPEQLDRYPHQFSGGQRQRIGIARALANDPKLIVADEPVSALDVSVQASVINLLQEIQRMGTAFLFIAHDLAVVEHACSRIAVMYLGKIMESGPSHALCAAPHHPYTQALLSAVPDTHREAGKQRIILKGDVPSPLNPPQGCPFHPRCPYAQEKCRRECPDLVPAGEPGREVRCFFPRER